MTDQPLVSAQAPFQVQRDRLSETTYRLRIGSAADTAATDHITWQTVIALLQNDAAFRSALTTALAAMPFSAFFWETPAITPQSWQQPWECVVVAAPALAQFDPDPSPFQPYFQAEAEIVTFPNLGGDAILVVPCERDAQSAYTHLAKFVRSAPAAQIDQLWQTLGQAIASHWHTRPDSSPLWVSTSGLGVYWLHVRLDNAPKYYTYAPYRTVN